MSRPGTGRQEVGRVGTGRQDVGRVDRSRLRACCARNQATAGRKAGGDGLYLVLAIGALLLASLLTPRPEAGEHPLEEPGVTSGTVSSAPAEPVDDPPDLLY